MLHAPPSHRQLHRKGFPSRLRNSPALRGIARKRRRREILGPVELGFPLCAVRTREPPRDALFPQDSQQQLRPLHPPPSGFHPRIARGGKGPPRITRRLPHQRSRSSLQRLLAAHHHSRRISKRIHPPPRRATRLIFYQPHHGF